MSTDFEWHPAGTKFAEQFPGEVQPIEIGMSAGGRQFTFRGYDLKFKGVKKVELTTYIATEIAFDVELKVRSFKDWIAFIKEQGGVIKNEYGTTYTLDEFIAYVEEDGPKAPPEKRGKNSIDVVLAEHSSAYWSKEYEDPSLHWKDPEGYAFSMS